MPIGTTQQVILCCVVNSETPCLSPTAMIVSWLLYPSFSPRSFCPLNPPPSRINANPKSRQLARTEADLRDENARKRDWKDEPGFYISAFEGISPGLCASRKSEIQTNSLYGSRLLRCNGTGRCIGKDEPRFCIPASVRITPRQRKSEIQAFSSYGSQMLARKKGDGKKAAVYFHRTISMLKTNLYRSQTTQTSKPGCA